MSVSAATPLSANSCLIMLGPESTQEAVLVMPRSLWPPVAAYKGRLGLTRADQRAVKPPALAPDNPPPLLDGGEERADTARTLASS